MDGLTKQQRYQRSEHGKAKAKERNQALYARRRAIIEEAKSSPCLDCGIKYPPYVMDFDHRPSETKSFTISENILSKSDDLLILEIQKCDVVCANCHRIRTHNRRSAME